MRKNLVFITNDGLDENQRNVYIVFKYKLLEYGVIYSKAYGNVISITSEDIEDFRNKIHICYTEAFNIVKNNIGILGLGDYIERLDTLIEQEINNKLDYIINGTGSIIDKVNFLNMDSEIVEGYSVYKDNIDYRVLGDTKDLGKIRKRIKGIIDKRINLQAMTFNLDNKVIVYVNDLSTTTPSFSTSWVAYNVATIDYSHARGKLSTWGNLDTVINRSRISAITFGSKENPIEIGEKKIVGNEYHWVNERKGKEYKRIGLYGTLHDLENLVYLDLSAINISDLRYGCNTDYMTDEDEKAELCMFMNFDYNTMRIEIYVPKKLQQLIVRKEDKNTYFMRYIHKIYGNRIQIRYV